MVLAGMIEGEAVLKEGILEVARLMAVAAKTAPKARGIDNIKILILDKKEELEQLAKYMEELADKYGAFFKRDADNVRNSDAVILIGASMIDLGLKSPEDYIADINLVMTLLNLGIALGSAVKTASIHNVDNRIMYSIGYTAQKKDLMKADIVIGVPLSAKGKSIYFDRKWPK